MVLKTVKNCKTLKNGEKFRKTVKKNLKNSEKQWENCEIVKNCENCIIKSDLADSRLNWPRGRFREKKNGPLQRLEGDPASRQYLLVNGNKSKLPLLPFLLYYKLLVWSKN